MDPNALASLGVVSTVSIVFGLPTLAYLIKQKFSTSDLRLSSIEEKLGHILLELRVVQVRQERQVVTEAKVEKIEERQTDLAAALRGFGLNKERLGD